MVESLGHFRQRREMQFIWVGLCVVAALIVILPPFMSPYLQGIMTKILIYAIFAMSLNLLLGYTGLLSFGHAAFFGVGGYTAGILMVRYGIESFWLIAPATILVTTFVAALLGLIALRVSGLYFLLITFALGQLVYTVVWKWDSMTGGDAALAGIGRPDLGLPWLILNDTYFYYFVLLAFVLSCLILYRIVNSPFGYALRGIRGSELRMINLGYNTWLYKYIAFIIAGLFAGIGGMLYAHFNGVMAPAHVAINNSGLVMIMVILGSPGTFFGPVIGAAVVIMLESFTSIVVPERWPLVIGVVFVVVVMFLREGIYFHLHEVWRKKFGER